MLQLVFLLTCPLIASSAAMVLAWNTLVSPWRFFVVTVATLYALYGVVFYLLGPASVGFAVHGLEPGQPRPEEPLFIYLEPYYTPLLVFAALAVPAVLGLLRLFKR